METRLFEHSMSVVFWRETMEASRITKSGSWTSSRLRLCAALLLEFPGESPLSLWRGRCVFVHFSCVAGR